MRSASCRFDGGMSAPRDIMCAGGSMLRLNLSPSLMPDEENLAKLLRIANLPAVVGTVEVLPDVHFKAKNFIPTGVCLQLRDTLAPMLVGPPNDAMILARVTGDCPDLRGARLDALFGDVIRRVAMFRRKEPAVSANLAMEIMRFGAPCVAGAWGFTVDDLAAMDFGGAFFSAGEEPEAAEILAAFPDPEGPRPSRLPGFVPTHSLLTSARHTMGVIDGGGHFLELLRVTSRHIPAAADHFGLTDDAVVVAAHLGSADVGLLAHRQFLPETDEDIACLDPASTEGRRFYVAMGAAANFAFANRLFVLKEFLTAFRATLGRDCGLSLISDAPHDLVEPHRLASGTTSYVHRKGVVRGLPKSYFPEGHTFATYGRPFFFPTSLGQDSYIMTRTMGEPHAFHVCSHGLGRSMTREEAMGLYTDEDVAAEIEKHGVRLYRYGHSGFSAQAPGAHKDMQTILGLLGELGLAEAIATVRPLASLKA